MANVSAAEDRRNPPTFVVFEKDSDECVAIGSYPVRLGHKVRKLVDSWIRLERDPIPDGSECFVTI
jgi:hypothetical protein